MEYILDSNMVIYYLNKALPENARQMIKQVITNGASISIITRLEVLGWYNCSDIEFQYGLRLIRQFTEIPLTDTIAKYCINIRHIQKVKLPDAIIAATAIKHDLPLLTRNVSDFEKVSGLKIINPFSVE